MKNTFSSLSIIWRYTLLELKIFFRNPSSVVFTLFLPLVFFSIWAGLNPGDPGDQAEKLARYLTPATLAWAILGNAVTQQAIQIPILREAGVLKRLKGTPLSPAMFFTARVLLILILMFFQSVLIIGLSTFLLKLVFVSWLALTAIILIGTLCFSAFGFALANLIPNGPAAPAIANAVFFPMLFLSGSFFSLEKAPRVLRMLGIINPATYLIQMLRNLYMSQGLHLHYSYGWGILAAWFLVSVLIAIFRFRWESKK